MRSFRRQRGGIYNTMFILGCIGLASMIGLKVLPIYLNHMKVEGAVEQICVSPKYRNATVVTIRKDLQKRWDVEDVQHLKVSDIKLIKLKTGGRALRFDYEVRTNLFSNWDLILWFKDERVIGDAT